MTQAEIAAIRNVIHRLRCDPRPSGRPIESDEVREALRGPAKLYLESWVIAALEKLLPGPDRDPRAAVDISRI